MAWAGSCGAWLTAPQGFRLPTGRCSRQTSYPQGQQTPPCHCAVQQAPHSSSRYVSEGLAAAGASKGRRVHIFQEHVRQGARKGRQLCSRRTRSVPRSYCTAAPHLRLLWQAARAACGAQHSVPAVRVGSAGCEACSDAGILAPLMQQMPPSKASGHAMARCRADLLSLLEQRWLGRKHRSQAQSRPWTLHPNGQRRAHRSQAQSRPKPLI